jgi:hypothetical protein
MNRMRSDHKFTPTPYYFFRKKKLLLFYFNLSKCIFYILLYHIFYFNLYETPIILCYYILSNNLVYLNNNIRFGNILLIYQNIIYYLLCFISHLFLSFFCILFAHVHKKKRQ